MKTMKTMMNILLVTFMLLFTFNGNSQVYEVGCGNDYNGFSDDTEHEIGYLSIHSSGSYNGMLCKIDWGIGEKYFTYTFKNVNEGTYDLVLDYEVKNQIQNLTNETNIKVNDEVKDYYNAEGVTTIDGVEPENGEVVIYFGLSEVSTITYLKSFKLEGQTASLQESNLDQLFKVFSFNDEINIQTTEFKNYDLGVYSISGRLVSNNMNLNGNFKKNISESGIYIVKLQFENEVLTKKLFIK